MRRSSNTTESACGFDGANSEWRAERGAYVSAEQLQANKNPGARAVAKILEYSIKRQQKLMEI